MSSKILLCCDLDRTLLPNGDDPESPQARPLLRNLAQHPELVLAYVSGRHKALLQEGIEKYGLPQPDYAICDVGTTIYEVVGETWQPWQAWRDEIAPDWHGMERQDLARLLSDIGELKLQEPAKQNVFKLSYYIPERPEDPGELLQTVHRRLDGEGVRASLIWSIDDIEDVGLLDILPISANKLHAIRFLMKHKDFPVGRTVFAGDSGNDLDVLTSGIQGILVRNAREDVRREAISRARAAGHAKQLYLAGGGFMGMNGNYAAGVLEGLVHFLPEAHHWLKLRSA